MIYQFDGTYQGFLCCVFESFERKEMSVNPSYLPVEQPLLFEEKRIIISDSVKAKRVINGLESKIGKNKTDDFYRGFLSEDDTAWRSMFRIIQRIFTGENDILDNYGDIDVLYFSQTLKKVSRERHRMKAFIRFNKSKDGLYSAIIEPDFNVLPLIVSFFKNRYTDQPWLIYDISRKYGMYYNLYTVEEIEILEEVGGDTNLPTVNVSLDDQDEMYQQLWKQYFKSTNIVARKNMKLHLRHVPRRYWKYLVEKGE